MKVIFLDIDGVLNNHDTLSEGIQIANTKCQLLKYIVNATDAKIVLSSTWRMGDLLSSIERMIHVCGGPYKAFVGATPVLTEIDGRQAIRGDEIDAWLKKTHHAIENYLIIDDDSDFHEHQKPFFIKTDMRTGLLSRDINKAIAILNNRKVTKNELPSYIFEVYEESDIQIKPVSGDTEVKLNKVRFTDADS